jgi:hypothetical protein
VTDAYTLVSLLADDDRRRVAAALVLGAASVDDVRAQTGLGARAAATAVARLVDGGLVVRGDDGTLHLLGGAFRQATIAAAPERPTPDPDGACFVEGRLVRIPTKRAQKLAVLDRLAQEFEVGVRYTEIQVNAALRRFHDDVAALRRYLVDDGFLDRDAGEYWRSGGTVR